MAGLAVLAMALLGESRSYWLLCFHGSHTRSTGTGSRVTAWAGYTLALCPLIGGVLA